MKKVIVLVCAVVLFASYSYAGILDSVKYYGEGSFYGYSKQGNGYHRGATTFWGTVGISADVYENISATLGLGYASLWGTRGGVDGTTGSGITSDGQSVGLLGEIKLIEANVAFDKLFDIDGLKLKIGRQFYGDEDSTVMYFGVRRNLPSAAAIYTYNRTGIPPITSIDAAALYYENEHIKANAVFATLKNLSVLASGYNKNVTISGVDFKYLNIIDMIDAQAYFYDMENAYSTRHYGIFGVKGTFHKAFNENVLKASIETAKNFAGDKILGENKDKSSNIIKLDASFNIKSIGLTPRTTFGLFGGYDKNSGYKEFANLGNYYPGLINGAGLSDYSNLQLFNLGADYTLKKFTFSLDFFNFSRRDDDRSKAAGEIDLQAKYAYNEKVDINVGIAHWFADDSDYDIAYYQAGLSYKF
jgi:hypothetical protein